MPSAGSGCEARCKMPWWCCLLLLRCVGTHGSGVSIKHTDPGQRFLTARICSAGRSLEWTGGAQELPVRCCGRGFCAVGPAGNRNSALSYCQSVRGFRLCLPSEAFDCCPYGDVRTHMLLAYTLADNTSEPAQPASASTYVYPSGQMWSHKLAQCWNPDGAGIYEHSGCCLCDGEASSACWRGWMTYEVCCPPFPGVRMLGAQGESVPPCRAAHVQVGAVRISQQLDALDPACVSWSHAPTLWLAKDRVALSRLGLPPGPLRILELGAGVGLTAVVLAGLNHSVLATDRSEAGLALASLNADNSLGPGHRSRFATRVWDWAGAAPVERFDVFLAFGGVFYMGLRAAKVLRGAFCRLCHVSPEARIVLQLPDYQEKKAFDATTRGLVLRHRADLFYVAPDRQVTVAAYSCPSRCMP
mmetsp:Transcript_74988/g.243705  ORF Transcript_74988/g.243705 Transcript_74988/m.243705 type:complete len:415 (+) Transcript_74988:155-1399(+)